MYPKKNVSNQRENQQTQLKYDAESGYQTRAPHWWAASVLITAPSQHLPKIGRAPCIVDVLSPLTISSSGLICNAIILADRPLCI